MAKDDFFASDTPYPDAPPHLEEDEKFTFEQILQKRGPLDWSFVDLELVAQMATLICMNRRLQVEWTMDGMGETVNLSNGGEAIRASVRLYHNNLRQIMALAKTLSLTASKNKELTKFREELNAIRQETKHIQDNRVFNSPAGGLLAKPPSYKTQ
ncbi:hypothetical protein SAMN05421759_102638 [Roseivivax lentus]|uniref:Uncharacterized protein n=1 Tax=Roseivivax lentus TaxID=633194 RepID=A0A1N7LET5_9RHOB|nr:hypothetical protein [Roseivivax lentus]SIS72281.1 hypothetical protein SAMN05421759_102638 [Roseivivax lentus]